MIAITVLLALGSALWVAFSEVGTGETRESLVGTGEIRVSPDGRYSASVCDIDRGTPEDWVEIGVTELGTGNTTMYRVKRLPLSGTAHDHGRQGKQFIEWAADSSAVTVHIGDGQRWTIRAP